MPFATADDVRKLIPRASLTDEERDLIEGRIARAERMIRHRIKDLDDQIIDGSIDEQTVADVIIEATLRVFRNPEGYTQETDGNYSYIISSENSGKLFISDDEWEELGIGVAGGAFWMTPIIRTPKV